MNKLHYVFVFFVVIAIALPAKSEIWGCNEMLWKDGAYQLNSTEAHPHPIELVSIPEQETGIIKVQGLPEIATRFGIEGLHDRTWRWQANTKYAFRIRFENQIGFIGFYFDFAGEKTTLAQRHYNCHKH